MEKTKKTIVGFGVKDRTILDKKQDILETRKPFEGKKSEKEGKRMAFVLRKGIKDPFRNKVYDPFIEVIEFYVKKLVDYLGNEINSVTIHYINDGDAENVESVEAAHLALIEKGKNVELDPLDIKEKEIPFYLMSEKVREKEGAHIFIMSRNWMWNLYKTNAVVVDITSSIIEVDNKLLNEAFEVLDIDKKKRINTWIYETTLKELEEEGDKLVGLIKSLPKEVGISDEIKSKTKIYNITLVARHEKYRGEHITEMGQVYARVKGYIIGKKLKEWGFDTINIFYSPKSRAKETAKAYKKGLEKASIKVNLKEVEELDEDEGLKEYVVVCNGKHIKKPNFSKFELKRKGANLVITHLPIIERLLGISNTYKKLLDDGRVPWIYHIDLFDRQN